jgi:hypothetical protein
MFFAKDLLEAPAPSFEPGGHEAAEALVRGLLAGLPLFVTRRYSEVTELDPQ